MPADPLIEALEKTVQSMHRALQKSAEAQKALNGVERTLTISVREGARQRHFWFQIAGTHGVTEWREVGSADGQWQITTDLATFLAILKGTLKARDAYTRRLVKVSAPLSDLSKALTFAAAFKES